MVIYGVTLLAFSFLLGLILGEFFGYLLGIDANLGGVGFAMLILIFLSNYLKVNLNFGEVSEKGITFWSAIYIPIVVAMAAKQNVIAAIDGGMIAIIGGSLSVFISFLMIPLISKIGK